MCGDRGAVCGTQRRENRGCKSPSSYDCVPVMGRLGEKPIVQGRHSPLFLPYSGYAMRLQAAPRPSFAAQLLVMALTGQAASCAESQRPCPSGLWAMCS